MHGRIPSVSQKPNSLTQPADEDVLLGQLLDFFYRRWELIAITALAVAALAFAVVMTLTPRYTATAQILLEQRKEKLFGADSIVPEFNLDTGNVDSQISVIQSLTLLKRVVEKYKLTEDPEFGVDDPPSLYVVMKQMIFGAKLKDEAAETLAANAPGYVEPHILKSIKRLERDLAVTRVGRTYVISIGVTSKDPMKAVKLANAVADAYVVDRLDARYDAAKRASTWMAERLEGLRDLVRMSEEAVAKFRQENNLTISSEGKVAVSEQQLSDLNARMVAARADSAEKHAKLDQAQKVKNAGGSLQNIPDVVRSNVISELRKQESEVTRKEADAAARYSDAHPTVVNARAERRDIERSISAEVGRIIANLKNDFDVAKAREASLQASLDALTGKDGGDGSVGVKLRELERTNLANKSE